MLIASWRRVRCEDLLFLLTILVLRAVDEWAETKTEMSLFIQ